jgi:hypothetical protein
MKMTFVKDNIIWKRIHDTHSLFIDDTTQEFVATIVTPTTTKSWPFQTFMGCHNWFTRELAKLGIKKSRQDTPNTPWSIEPKPTHWPNGDIRKNKWES